MASITVVQLRAFVAIAATQHFGDAAAMIGVSQPTLSQALSTLEANLDVQLVERNPRQVLVTAAGLKLLPFAQQAVGSRRAYGSFGDDVQLVCVVGYSNDES